MTSASVMSSESTREQKPVYGLHAIGVPKGVELGGKLQVAQPSRFRVAHATAADFAAETTFFHATDATETLCIRAHV